ncbi:putative tRNA pseudouridine synthase Pus10 [Entomortierella beljakovae]|nr:putative tRNA pseudouridine synthase Pus10 [Entomortierella beljakovae]
MSLNKRIGEGLEHDPKRIKKVYTGEVLRKELKAKLEKALVSLEEVLNNPNCLDVLLSLDLCGRCMLRFVGLREFHIYRLSSEDIKETLSDHHATLSSSNASTSSRTRSNSDPGYICTACVGTVQYAEDFVGSILEYIAKENYDVKTFNMNVTLPPSTLVRNHSISIFWDQKLSLKPTDQVDIKEIFKMLISWPIQEETGIVLDFSSELKIQVSIMHDETKDDHVFLSKMKESGMVIKTKRENRRHIVVGDGRHNIVKALTCVSDSRFTSEGNVPPNQVSSKPEIQSIEMTRESVYLGGRYLKFSRDVSQTPWSIGTTILAELSVSGTICPSVRDSYRADDFKFVTAGREDANVRMLGNGRPFYIELINPRVSSQPADEGTDDSEKRDPFPESISFERSFYGRALAY